VVLAWRIAVVVVKYERKLLYDSEGRKYDRPGHILFICRGAKLSAQNLTLIFSLC